MSVDKMFFMLWCLMGLIVLYGGNANNTLAYAGLTLAMALGTLFPGRDTDHSQEGISRKYWENRLEVAEANFANAPPESPEGERSTRDLFYCRANLANIITGNPNLIARARFEMDRNYHP